MANSNQLVFKPIGHNTRRFVVVLPSIFTEKTKGVELLDSKGNVIESASYRSTGNGNRGNWDFDKPGSAYGGTTVKITLDNGEQISRNYDGKRYIEELGGYKGGGSTPDQAGGSSSGGSTPDQAGGSSSGGGSGGSGGISDYNPEISTTDQGNSYIPGGYQDYTSLVAPNVDFNANRDRAREEGQFNKENIYSNYADSKDTALGFVNTDIEGIKAGADQLSPYVRSEADKDQQSNIDRAGQIDQSNMSRIPGLHEFNRGQVADNNDFNQTQRDQAVNASGLNYRQRMGDTLDSIEYRAKTGKLQGSLDESLSKELANRGSELGRSTGVSSSSRAGIRANDRMTVNERVQMALNAESQLPGVLQNAQQTLSSQEERAPTIFAQPTNVPFTESNINQRLPVTSSVSAGAAQQAVGSEVNQYGLLPAQTILSSGLQTDQYNETGRYNRDLTVLDRTQDQMTAKDNAFRGSFNADKAEDIRNSGLAGGAAGNEVRQNADTSGGYAQAAGAIGAGGMAAYDLYQNSQTPDGSGSGNSGGSSGGGSSSGGSSSGGGGMSEGSYGGGGASGGGTSSTGGAYPVGSASNGGTLMSDGTIQQTSNTGGAEPVLSGGSSGGGNYSSGSYGGGSGDAGSSESPSSSGSGNYSSGSYGGSSGGGSATTSSSGGYTSGTTAPISLGGDTSVSSDGWGSFEEDAANYSDYGDSDVGYSSSDNYSKSKMLKNEKGDEVAGGGKEESGAGGIDSNGKMYKDKKAVAKEESANFKENLTKPIKVTAEDKRLIKDTANALERWDKLDDTQKLTTAGTVGVDILEQRGLISKDQASQIRQGNTGLQTILDPKASDVDKGIAVADIINNQAGTRFTGSANAPTTINGNKVVGSAATKDGLEGFMVDDGQGGTTVVPKSDVTNASNIAGGLQAISVLTSNASTENKLLALAQIGIKGAAANGLISDSDGGNVASLLSLISTAVNFDQMSTIQQGVSIMQSGQTVLSGLQSGTFQTGANLVGDALGFGTIGTDIAQGLGGQATAEVTTEVGTQAATQIGTNITTETGTSLAGATATNAGTTTASTIGGAVTVVGGLASIYLGVKGFADTAKAAGDASSSQGGKIIAGAGIAGLSVGLGVAAVAAGSAAIASGAVTGATVGSTLGPIGAVVGAAIGVAIGVVMATTGSSKGTGQMMRDSWRKGLESGEFATVNAETGHHELTLADGSKYDVGLDGKSFLPNKGTNIDGQAERHTTAVDWSNPVAVESIPEAHLFSIATGLDPTNQAKLGFYHRAVGMSNNAATSNATNIDEVRANYKTMLNKVDPANLGMRLETLRCTNAISEKEYNVFLDRTNKIFGTEFAPQDRNTITAALIKDLESGRDAVKPGEKWDGYGKDMYETLTNPEKFAKSQARLEKRMGKEREEVTYRNNKDDIPGKAQGPQAGNEDLMAAQAGTNQSDMSRFGIGVGGQASLPQTAAPSQGVQSRPQTAAPAVQAQAALAQMGATGAQGDPSNSGNIDTAAAGQAALAQMGATGVQGVQSRPPMTAAQAAGAAIGQAGEPGQDQGYGTLAGQSIRTDRGQNSGLMEYNANIGYYTPSFANQQNNQYSNSRMK
jgi:hypothetical protein